jgi:tetratricopeptide (TPR) repeat protein
MSFTGCEKLKIDNLRANHHLQKANDHYTKEKFKKAIEEYETALQYNPKLEFVYFYLGTANALMYKPGKDTERNKDYGDNALKYLLKAKEVEPEENQVKVTLSLGDIYDKMENFEEAEKYYLQILNEAPDKADTYYILADFYSKYGKLMEAESMYEKRIALNPDDPSGYFFYANFLGNRRKFDEAIKYHEKRIHTMVDPEIERVQSEVDKLTATVENIEKIQKFMETVKKNRRVDKAEKERILTEKTKQIEELGNLEELNAQIEEKTAIVNGKLEKIEEVMLAFEEDKRKVLARANYTIGVVCWNKSYQTGPNMMAPEERLAVADLGFKFLGRATKLDVDYPDPWAYMKLLYLEKVKAEPLKREEYMASGDEAGAKFLKLRKKLMEHEAYMRQLEQVGKE